MVRCPRCRMPIAEPAGLCTRCGHDLDKHAWLLGSIEPGRMRKRIVRMGTAFAAVILLLLILLA